MDQRNLLLAVVLSLAILVTWEVFIGGPQREKLIEQVQQADQAIDDAPIRRPVGVVVAADNVVERHLSSPKFPGCPRIPTTMILERP